VSKYTIDIDDLKERFKQIAGFHFVSSKTMMGIDDLAKEIIDDNAAAKVHRRVHTRSVSQF
jgi:hypothetical protein